MNKKIMKTILSVLIALAVVFNCYGLLKNGEEKSDNALSLAPPPFVVRAAEIEIKSATAFPESQAGISAYVNVGKSINLTDAVKAFKQLLELDASHAVGILSVGNRAGTLDVRVYVDTNGWIVAYFPKNEPSSKVVLWEDMDFDSPAITETTLHRAIKEVCRYIDVYYTNIKDNIGVYHFRYPDANKMMILVNTRSSGGEERVYVSIPANYTVREISWGLIGICCCYWCDTTAQLYLDGNGIGSIEWRGGLAYGTYNLENQFTIGTPHTITFWTSTQGGMANVIIYKE